MRLSQQLPRPCGLRSGFPQGQKDDHDGHHGGDEREQNSHQAYLRAHGDRDEADGSGDDAENQAVFDRYVHSLLHWLDLGVDGSSETERRALRGALARPEGRVGSSVARTAGLRARVRSQLRLSAWRTSPLARQSPTGC